IGVVPSVWPEPMGLVAVEAMLLGCPVIASDVGGLSDVVDHERTGLLIPPGDPGMLAATLDRLLDEPALRQRLGDAGRVRGRRFEAAVVAPRVLEVFDAALTSRSARKRGSPAIPVPHLQESLIRLYDADPEHHRHQHDDAT